MRNAKWLIFADTCRTICQAALTLPTPQQHFHVYYKSYIKGIVQRDLTGVETRLKKSVLLSYSVGKFFFNFKGTPSWEKHKTGFSVLTTIELNLLVEFTKSCKLRPPYNDIRNLAHTGWWSYGTTPVPYNHQPAQISRDSWFLSMYGMILHRTIILWSSYHTVLSSAGTGVILYLVS